MSETKFENILIDISSKISTNIKIYVDNIFVTKNDFKNNNQEILEKLDLLNTKLDDLSVKDQSILCLISI